MVCVIGVGARSQQRQGSPKYAEGIQAGQGRGEAAFGACVHGGGWKED